MAQRLSVISIALLSLGLSACTLKDDPPPPGGPRTIPAPADVAAPPADALRTASGISSKVLQVGLGTARPSARSIVRVHYTGWTTNGMMFDSSVTKGQPIEMPVSQFIPGWIEGLQLMVLGEKRRFWIPGHLAYGEPTGRPPGPGDPPLGMLVFDIELIDVR